VPVSRFALRHRGQMVIRQCLCLLILGLVAAACSSNLAVLPDATPPPATARPNCPAAPPTRLILKQRGRVLPDDPRPINLRAEPGTGSDLITEITIMEVFYVLEGPVCDGDYAWYKIQYGGDEGWIAEGDFSSYYVEPYLPD
jgi:hypothetical protein